MQVVGSLFYTYYVFERFCVPQFKNIGQVRHLCSLGIILLEFGANMATDRGDAGNGLAEDAVRVCVHVNAAGISRAAVGVLRHPSLVAQCLGRYDLRDSYMQIANIECDADQCCFWWECFGECLC